MSQNAEKLSQLASRRDVEHFAAFGIVGVNLGDASSNLTLANQANKSTVSEPSHVVTHVRLGVIKLTSYFGCAHGLTGEKRKNLQSQGVSNETESRQ